jgi:hypothetical protein
LQKPTLPGFDSPMSDDNLKDQRAAFEFFSEKYRTQEAFTKGELQAQTSWDWKSTTTYWSKQYEPFTKAVPPILTGAAQKDQKFRVTRAFLPFGSWTKFRRHVSQKRRLTYEYEHEIFDTVLLFDFFLPLTNETVPAAVTGLTVLPRCATEAAARHRRRCASGAVCRFRRR